MIIVPEEIAAEMTDEVSAEVTGMRIAITTIITMTAMTAEMIMMIPAAGASIPGTALEMMTADAGLMYVLSPVWNQGRLFPSREVLQPADAKDHRIIKIV